MTHIELGIFGEGLAVQFLRQQNIHIRDCNFKFKKGEIDIVGETDDLIIIYEVKTRETAEIGEPYKAVTRSKQKQIIKVADFYVKQMNLHKDVRFDIISIVHNSYRTKIEHIEDAFFPM